MFKIQTYLNFAGNSEEAFGFYKSVFGGEYSSLIRFQDMPVEGFTLPENEQTKIMHISLPIGQNAVLMASDTLESLGHVLNKGNNFYISIHPDSKEESERIFNSLSAGGVVEMPFAVQVWGDYYGSFTDKFGVQWMVNYAMQNEN